MGYNATVVVMVDALTQIERDPEFGASLSRAIREHMSGSSRPGRTDVRAGSHYNAAHVVETHHADSTAVITVGGNLGVQQHYSYGWHHQEQEGREKLLREWAAKLGFDLVRKEAESAAGTADASAAAAAVPTYLLVLSGGGDTTVKLVTGAVWNWIHSEYESEHSSYDERVPADVISDSATSGNVDYFEDGKLHITRGSFENDRALAAPGRDFDDVAEATAYLASLNLEVKEEYYGCIY
jgi:hypothetical protein